MSPSTNPLVAAARKWVAPAVLSATAALGALAVFNHTGVHAAQSASSLDDHSVAALTSLDQAMEALAARVTPAVVNIAVTSTPSAEAAEEHGQGGRTQGLPPGFEQFFGPGGPFGGAGGGRIVATGTPEEIAGVKASHTGRFLREVLERRPVQQHELFTAGARAFRCRASHPRT